MGPEVRSLRLGTRGSRLARWQAEHVAERLRAAHSALRVETVVITTAGDRIRDRAPSAVGDKGLFTRELEEALVSGAIDIAVHSLKDLPTSLPEGLKLGAVLEREDPRDVLVSAGGLGLRALPEGSRLGTSSLRRRAQLLLARPDLRVVDLRGNVPTRLRRVEEGACEAAVLARAGLLRLGLQGRISEVLDPEVMLPAPGQGAIAVESRVGDRHIAELIAALDDEPTRLAVTAERGLLARLEGGCQVPVGARASRAGDHLVLDGLVADVDGRGAVRGLDAAPAMDAAGARGLGERLAERLLAQGGATILERARAQVAAGLVGQWEEA